MTLRLNGSTSGYTEIDAPAVAGSNTLVLPGGNGSADQVLSTNGSGALSFVDRGRMVLGTSQASTSGTSIDFTGIPSWVKRITINLAAVSTNSTSIVQVQIGSGSYQTSGYNTTSAAVEGTSVGSLNAGSGFILDPGGGAAFARSGAVVLSLQGNNFWVVSYNLLVTGSASSRIHYGAGNSGFLSGTLDRVRITTVNGTDTFDAGSINILYEG